MEGLASRFEDFTARLVEVEERAGASEDTEDSRSYYDSVGNPHDDAFVQHHELCQSMRRMPTMEHIIFRGGGMATMQSCEKSADIQLRLDELRDDVVVSTLTVY